MLADTLVAPKTPVPREARPYQPFGSALELMYAKDDEVIIDGPAGTGKSRGCLEKMHLICLKYPGARILTVRKTRASLTQSALVTLDQHVIPPYSGIKWRATEQEYRYPNGSRLVVGGMDKSTRVLSTDYDIIYIQEGIELNEEEYEVLLTRARNGIVPYQQVVTDCNPGPTWHWIKTRFDSGKARRIKSSHKDNPRLYDHELGKWTPFGKKYLAKLQNLTGTRYERLYLGNWVSAEGAVFPSWDANLNRIIPFKIPRSWRRIIVVDFGFVNPFVAAWFAIDEDERMFCYRQIYMTKRTVRDHAQQIKALTGDEEIEAIICDHDAEDRATMHENGLVTIPAMKAVSVGLQKVEERLQKQEDGRARLYYFYDSLVEVDPDLEESGKPICIEDEYDDYVWQDSKKKEIPIQVNDHGMDTSRYGVMYVDNYSSLGGFHI